MTSFRIRRADPGLNGPLRKARGDFRYLMSSRAYMVTWPMRASFSSSQEHSAKARSGAISGGQRRGVLSGSASRLEFALGCLSLLSRATRDDSRSRWVEVRRWTSCSVALFPRLDLRSLRGRGFETFEGGVFSCAAFVGFNP